MDREQAGLTFGVPTGVGAIMLAVSGVGWLAILLGGGSLTGFTWGFWPQIRTKIGLEGPTIADSNIAISIIEKGYKSYIKVTNRDSVVRRFRGTLTVLGATWGCGDKINYAHPVWWDHGGAETSEIFPHDNDLIWVAQRQTHRDDPERVTPAFSEPYTSYEIITYNEDFDEPWQLCGPTHIHDSRPPPQVIFRITIVGEPELVQGHITRFYRLNRDGLTEISESEAS